MPAVTMRRRISGKRNGRDWPEPGQTIDVGDDEARTLVRLGLADGDVPAPAPVEDEKPAEDPVEEPAEEAVDLEAMKLAELRELAAERGLSASGNKAALLDRLRGE